LESFNKDRAALEELEKKIAAGGRRNSVELIHGEFEEVTSYGDVVYFEPMTCELALL